MAIYSGSALSCSCAPFDVNEYAEYAEKVYIGRVISLDDSENKQGEVASLKVTEKFLGNPLDTEEVMSSLTSCGLRFKLQKKYLVFANKRNRVNMCSMMELNHLSNLGAHLKTLRILGDAAHQY